MAYDFVRLADVEALSEVPENATVLAEVNGAIKRVPGNGLGGSGNTIVLVQDVDSDSASPNVLASGYAHSTFTANMNFTDAMEAFRAHEITGAAVYLVQSSSNPSALESESTSATVEMLDYAFVDDRTYNAGMDCLVFMTLNSSMSIYWTADGISTEAPSSGK